MPNYRHAYDRKEAAELIKLIVNIERYVISVKGQRHRKILSRRFHACAPHMRYMVHTLSGIGLVLRVWSLKDIERLIPPLNVATEGADSVVTRWASQRLSLFLPGSRFIVLKFMWACSRLLDTVL